MFFQEDSEQAATAGHGGLLFFLECCASGSVDTLKQREFS